MPGEIMQSQMQDGQPEKFNLKTHHFDHRGRLLRRSPYRCHVIGGTQYFEQPVNSGNLFYENNAPAGRMEYTFNKKGKIETKKFVADAEHIAYEAPLTGIEKVHVENKSLVDEVSALKAELAAMKAERESRVQPAPTQQASEGSATSALARVQAQMKEK